MKTNLLRLALFVFCTCAFVAHGSAQTAAGLIKVTRVKDMVLRLTADGQSIPLKVGDLVTESDTIKTGPTGETVLVFMNGSSVKLSANSLLKIEEFKMDPLGEDIYVGTLKSEPSVSKTKLYLAEGELVGDVKKLNRDLGSSYTVRTPVGAAGIRGTIFRIIFTPTGNGKAFTFSLVTAEGVVVYDSATDGTTIKSEGLDVPAGKQISVTVDIDETTGKVKIIEATIPKAATDVDQSTLNSIKDVTKNAINKAQDETTFTEADNLKVKDLKTETTTKTETKEEKKDEPEDDTPPKTTTPTTVLTNFDGSSDDDNSPK